MAMCPPGRESSWSLKRETRDESPAHEPYIVLYFHSGLCAVPVRCAMVKFTGKQVYVCVCGGNASMRYRLVRAIQNGVYPENEIFTEKHIKLALWINWKMLYTRGSRVVNMALPVIALLHIGMGTTWKFWTGKEIKAKQLNQALNARS